jgi:hypothetical protein
LEVLTVARVINFDDKAGGVALINCSGRNPVTIKTGTIDFSDKYPTGGEAFDLSGYLNGNIKVIPEQVPGYFIRYDKTSKTLVAYVASTGAEVAKDVDLSTALAGVAFIAWSDK